LSGPPGCWNRAREAGDLGKSAGATLTKIAEDFPPDEPIQLSPLVDVLETSPLRNIILMMPVSAQ
jgi:hypothetical protein